MFISPNHPQRLAVDHQRRLMGIFLPVQLTVLTSVSRSAGDQIEKYGSLTTSGTEGIRSMLGLPSLVTISRVNAQVIALDHFLFDLCQRLLEAIVNLHAGDLTVLDFLGVEQYSAPSGTLMSR